MTSREIAIAFWGAVFLLWVLGRRELRASLADILRVALHWKMALPVGLFVLYTAVVVRLLFAGGWWGPDDLKDTLVWSVGSGLALAMSGVGVSSKVPSLRVLLSEQVGPLILIEYVSNTFTFALWIELVTVPLIVCVGMLDAVAGLKAEHASAKRVTRWLLPTIGFVIAGLAIRKAMIAWSTIRVAAVAHEMALPIVLSAGLLPLAYVFFLVAAYEQLFVRMQFGIKDPRIRRYARRRLLFTLRLSPRRMRQFVDANRGRAISAETQVDVDDWIRRAVSRTTVDNNEQEQVLS